MVQNNGTYWDNRDNYRLWDPSSPERILQWDTPMLVIHSEHDYRLPVSEGVALFNVLQELGIPSRFLNFPDENHWYVGFFYPCNKKGYGADIKQGTKSREQPRVAPAGARLVESILRRGVEECASSELG